MTEALIEGEALPGTINERDKRCFYQKHKKHIDKFDFIKTPKNKIVAFKGHHQESTKATPESGGHICQLHSR